MDADVLYNKIIINESKKGTRLSFHCLEVLRHSIEPCTPVTFLTKSYLLVYARPC